MNRNLDLLLTLQINKVNQEILQKEFFRDDEHTESSREGKWTGAQSRSRVGGAERNADWQ